MERIGADISGCPRAPRAGRRVAGLALLGILAATALAAAGCGRSAEEAFRVDELNPREEVLQTEKSRLSAQLRTVRLGRRQDVRAVNRQIDRIAAAGDRIAELSPPPSARIELARYAIANRGLALALRDFARILGEGREKPLNRAGERAQEAAGAAQRAETALDDALNK